MSLYHIADKLNHLSDRRYNKGRHDIPKILANYYRFTLSLSIPVTRGKNYNLVNYIRQRLQTFRNFLPSEWVPQAMPAENIRNQWWVDPRVEFGIQNRRERR